MKKTMAQALVEFLKVQQVARDGQQQPFFAGCFGIFGHGNVAGVGEALQENPDFRYYQARNEQSMVHSAIGFAKMKNRLGTLACTSSIGPGATNMVTGAATATINRLPVLLLPGDIFANRKVAPVLQQLEAPWSHDVIGQRLLPPGVHVLGPHQPTGSAGARADGSDAGAHLARIHRCGDALPAARRPDRGLRLSRPPVRAAGLGHSARPS